MTQQAVSSEQRFKRWGHHCPICNGHSGLKQGRGERCAGYESDDGEYIFCTREEYAGNLELNEKTSPPAFCHKFYGLCKCGKVHNPERSTSNGHQKQARRELTTYSYYDKKGRLAYQTVRYDPKDFIQRRPDEKGGWVYDLHGVTRVPYRLPELLKAPLDSIVHICEGEKAADAAASLGVIATTNVGGALNWTPSNNTYFQGRHVVILPDNDEKGMQHAKKVAESLTGIARTIRIIELPDLPEKGDICEWIEAGGTREALEQVTALPRRKFTYASEVQEQPIEWLWEGRLAKGELTLGVGDAGIGKGLTLSKAIADITRGKALPGGPKIAPSSVILMSPEDSASRTIVPRLRAAGADLSKVLLLSEVDDTDPMTGEVYKRPVSFPEDSYILREAIEDSGAVAVFIDPILSMISGKIDVYKNHAVRQALAQVMSTASKHGAAVFGIIHTTKGQHPNALFRSSSSTAFIEMARVALFFVPDPDGEEEKSGVIVNHKNNLAERAASTRYAIHTTADRIGYITWEGMSTRTRDELLNQTGPTNNLTSEKLDDITRILKENVEAMTADELLPYTKQKPDALRMMLSRKVEEGVLMRTSRGKYTYAGNTLYEKEHVTNVTNVTKVNNVTNVTSGNEDEYNIVTSDVIFKNALETAQEASPEECNICNITNKSKPDFSCNKMYEGKLCAAMQWYWSNIDQDWVCFKCLSPAHKEVTL